MNIPYVAAISQKEKKITKNCIKFEGERMRKKMSGKVLYVYAARYNFKACSVSMH